MLLRRFAYVQWRRQDLLRGGADMDIMLWALMVDFRA